MEKPRGTPSDHFFFFHQTLSLTSLKTKFKTYKFQNTIFLLPIYFKIYEQNFEIQHISSCIFHSIGVGIYLIKYKSLNFFFICLFFLICSQRRVYANNLTLVFRFSSR